MSQQQEEQRNYSASVVGRLEVELEALLEEIKLAGSKLEVAIARIVQLEEMATKLERDNKELRERLGDALAGD